MKKLLLIMRTSDNCVLCTQNIIDSISLFVPAWFPLSAIPQGYECVQLQITSPSVHTPGEGRPSLEELLYILVEQQTGTYYESGELCFMPFSEDSIEPPILLQ